MPGAGKSTTGVLLAKETARDFVDTDLLIQVAETRSLQQILDEEGYMALRRIEARVLLSTNYKNSVVATGGSAAYSHGAMMHLKVNGTVVFLQVDFEELKRRITNFDTRGIARAPSQTFSDLFRERKALYNRYADVTIDCVGKTQEEIVWIIRETLMA